MGSYPRLFSPLKVGRLELSNRVMMPSMGSNLADSDGRVTRKMVEYYRARAQGRPGLMVVEAASVHPTGRVIKNHLMIHDDESLDGLGRLVEVIKGEGVPTIVQLFHAGRNAHPRLVGEPLAPSPIKGPVAKVTPRALTILEIEAMVECFARAAQRALQAGFDGVEVHAAHEYLVHQFLTPYCNRRSDAYGGDFEGRCRFAREVITAVRRALGPEPLLCVRLSGNDHVRGGLDPEQAAEIAGLMVEWGADLISVTGGVYETPHMVVPPLSQPVATHLEAATYIRERVSVPVVGVGRINSAVEAERALEGVDLVACGRAFLADPYWLDKARQGREDRTRPCIGCNQGCIDRILNDQSINCVANPWLGLEGEKFDLRPLTDGGAKVVVVGGGLAGLEAARCLGALGHQVVLFEASAKLGGQMLLAAVPPGKDEMQRLVDYYLAVVEGLETVEVRLGREATVDDVCELNPQAVVVATGSSQVLPNLPGADRAPLVTARQVLAGEVAPGKRVAVLGGGNLGSEVAHYLARKGHEVSIIELGLGIGSDLGPARRYLLRRELSQFKIRRHVRSKVWRLFPDRVSFLHIQADGQRLTADVGPVDTFVVALGSRPRESLYLALESRIKHLFLVGDALSPARMGEATSEGARAGLEIHRRYLAGELDEPHGGGKHCAA